MTFSWSGKNEQTAAALDVMTTLVCVIGVCAVCMMRVAMSGCRDIGVLLLDDE